MAYLTVEGQIVDNTADFDNPYAPFDVVINRFDTTLAKAEEVYALLIGTDGDGGFLGDLNSIITTAPTVSITPQSIDTSLVLETSGEELPAFDEGDLQDFPVETYVTPTIEALPSVDTNFADTDEPDDVSVALSWSESALPTEVYDAILVRMLADLQSGATGLDPVVEQAIYDRARLRQQADRLAEYNRIVDTASSLQFQFPSGVLLSGITDFGIGATRSDSDIENQIIVTQGDLAQKNSQFIMQQAVALEQLIRQTRDSESGRALDAAKTTAQLIAEDFKNRIQRYLAIWEGRKIKVQAQVDALRGVIEGNKGAIDIYKTQYDALKTRIDAVTSYNKGLTDVYVSRVQGFGEAERAVSSRNDSAVKLIAAKVSAAEIDLRGQITEAEQLIQGYIGEMSLREKVSNDLASIAAQVVASMMSAVHAGATLGYSGSESSSKSFSMGSHLDEKHEYSHGAIT